MRLFIPAAALVASFSLSSLASAPAPADHKPVKMAYTFAGGEPILYRIKSDSNVVQNIMGEVTTTSQTTGATISRELIETGEDGTLVIEERDLSYSQRNASAEGDFSYDSTNPDDASKKDDPMVRAAVVSMDWPTELLMRPTGEVVGVKNLDEQKAQIAGIDEPELREELSDNYEPAAQIREINPFTYLLPEKAVGVGDQWNCSFSMEDEEMGMTANETMTVKSIRDIEGGQEVVVEFSGGLDMKLPPEFPAFVKVTRKSIEGRFVFNTGLGTVTTYRSDLSLRIAGSPGEGMGEISIETMLSMEYEMVTE